MTPMPPSPFLNSAAPPVVESAVASNLPPAVGAAAESIPAREQRYPPGCPDPDWCTANKGCYWNCRDDGTDCIGEIFHHARKLIAEDNRRAEDFVDWPALEAALEEPLPLFIRDGEYLKRRAA